ncbi:hypothetical protein, partial [Escherichia coli]|uniref:hypothetical protein n=1 Tax=Escherichia coli TaxID=562 RepID=UPI002022E3EE
VLHRAALDQGQDELAVFQADEEVAVLGAFGDATEIPQAAQVVGGEEGFQGPFTRYSWMVLSPSWRMVTSGSPEGASSSAAIATSGANASSPASIKRFSVR